MCFVMHRRRIFQLVKRRIPNSQVSVILTEVRLPAAPRDFCPGVQFPCSILQSHALLTSVGPLVSNLMLYALSTSTVVSGRDRYSTGTAFMNNGACGSYHPLPLHPNSGSIAGGPGLQEVSGFPDEVAVISAHAAPPRHGGHAKPS